MDDYHFHNFFQAQENLLCSVKDLIRLARSIIRDPNISFNSKITPEILFDNKKRLEWFAGLNQEFSIEKTDQLFKNIWENTLSDYLEQTLPNSMFQLFKTLQDSLNKFDTYDTYLFDEQEHTWLHHFVQQENFPAVQWLLQKGADPALLSSTRDNAFHFAAGKKDCKILQSLCQAAHMRYGSDISEIIDQINKNQRKTPLHLAIKSNNLSAVKLLLEKGADPLIKDKGGFRTFYMTICNWNTPEKSEELTALEYLCNAVEHKYQDPTFLKKVLNQADKNRNIPLNYAISREDLSIISLLLNKGSNPLFERTGCTVEHPSTLCAAIRSKKDGILSLLLEYAKEDEPALVSALKQKDRSGKDLFDYARETKNPFIVEQLYNILSQSR